MKITLHGSFEWKHGLVCLVIVLGDMNKNVRFWWFITVFLFCFLLPATLYRFIVAYFTARNA